MLIRMSSIIIAGAMSLVGLGCCIKPPENQASTSTRPGSSERYLRGGSWTGTDAVWTQDGKHILFAGLNGKSSDIYQVAVDGTGITPLTESPYWERTPVPGKNGSFFFLSDQDAPDKEWYFV